jgi:hypothetical protein
MATQKSIGCGAEGARQVSASALSRVGKNVWGHWADRYSGSADDLVEAGLVRRDQIPGVAGMNTSSCTFYDGKLLKRGQCAPKDEGYMQVRLSGKKIDVIKGVPKEVEEQRRAADHARMDCERERARQETAKRREALDAPTSPEAFRTRALAGIRVILDAVLNPIFPEVGGYRFALDDEDRAELNDALGQIEQVFESAAVSVNRAKRAELAAIRSHLQAREDGPLQVFLRSVTRKAGHG